MTFRNTNKISFIADSSEGSWPRIRALRRKVLCRLSITLVDALLASLLIDFGRLLAYQVSVVPLRLVRLPFELNVNSSTS